MRFARTSGLLAVLLVAAQAHAAGVLASRVQSVALGANECAPACEAGFVCAKGRCVSACNPPCAEGQQCRADGECVAAAVASPPPPPPPPSAATCVPSCRAGYLCLSGQCVSACNPPCAGGERCTANGECVRTTPSAVDFAQRPSQRQSHWAGTAGVVGIIGTVLVLGVGGASAALNDSKGASLAAGAIAFVIGGVMGPIVEVGASSARYADGISGSTVARVIGWVTYGLAGVAAAAMLITSASGEKIDVGPTIGITVSGAVAMICFTVDAFVSSSSASEYERTTARAPSVGVLPTFALTPRPDGSVVPMLGLALAH